jgi:hypothetical protein
MTAGEAAVQAYGGRCGWCGSTDRLELDPIDQGTGNAYRRMIGTTREYELWSGSLETPDPRA